jgi:ATPase subunit of ABC transporter with duplicated ATPase domains
MTEEDGIKVADLEIQIAELDGYTAERPTCEILSGAGIDDSIHFGPMSEVAPGWKLRVLLAQALFSDPDILLLDEPTNNLDVNTIRCLESVLNERKSTMVIVSHDSHFLNAVCTHMVDIEYGTLKVYSANYDDFMIPSTQARERVQSQNVKKKAQTLALNHFVSCFSANASKAKQATSRAGQIENIELDEIKLSSRVRPSIGFTQEAKLHRLALILAGVGHSFEEAQLFDNGDMIEESTRLAIIGENGVGKSTLLKCLMDDLDVQAGTIKWAENAELAYCPQESQTEFDEDTSLFDGMSQWRKPGFDGQIVRATPGRLLFSTEGFNKKVKVCSGGEKNRLLFGAVNHV